MSDLFSRIFVEFSYYLLSDTYDDFYFGLTAQLRPLVKTKKLLRLDDGFPLEVPFWDIGLPVGDRISSPAQFGVDFPVEIRNGKVSLSGSIMLDVDGRLIHDVIGVAGCYFDSRFFLVLRLIL